MILGLIACLYSSPAAAEQGCGAAWEWKTAYFEGEVYGTIDFAADVGPNKFVLTPVPFGWRIGMRDSAGNGLPVFSPPVRPVEADALNVAGWHFRNRDNSGPNRGEVNAPQTLRKFTFGRRATDPTLNPELIAPAVMPTEGEQGNGELIIEDFGLADLEPGKRARLVYMKFRGCVEWDPGHRETTLAQTAAPGVAAGPVIAAMEACGLDANTYRLSDRMGGGREGGQRPWLEPDLDGDALNDLVVPITRLSDDAPGLAICLRQDKKLALVGYDGRIGKHLDPEYFGFADWWNVYERGPVSQGVGEAPPPTLRGEAILFGKESASSVLLYLDTDGRVTSYWQGD
jgi:hypothetical protein